MIEVRDLLKHLEVINDQEYTKMKGMKSIYSSPRFGRTVYYCDRGYMRELSDTHAYITITGYIKNNGKAFGKMYSHYRHHQELDGNHVYITGNLICIHYHNREEWADCIGIYHRDTFDIVNISKNNILYNDGAKRYVIRQLA